MIECFWAPTPNSRRVTIMLEECAIPYERKPVDLAAGDHKSPTFLALNPAGAVPLLRDFSSASGAPLVLAQSGAICLYLAEKAGKLLPPDNPLRAETLQWFTWALSDLSGTATALYRLGLRKPETGSALRIMEDRMSFLLGLLDSRLQGRDYIARDFSIADAATYPVLITPFVSSILAKQTQLARVRDWLDLIGQRPGIQRGL